MGRPAVKFVRPLSEADQDYLKKVWREHKVYTVRCRAHAVLLSARGFTVSEIQEVFDISKPTALGWIDRWEERGRIGLEDEPRPGGPPSLDEEEQEILKDLLKRFPRQPKRVLQALKEQTGKVISRSTLRRFARKLGLRWKRFRRSTQKPPDHPRRFRLAMEEIEELRSMADLELAYFDEAAFSLQGVVPYGWQPIGQRSRVTVGTQRGNVQVLGIQEESGITYGYLHRGKVCGKTVAEVLDDYSQRIERPTVLILDNASVHTCRLVEDQMETWNERGLCFYFLPPQSPELNDIERLWKKLKYQDLPIAAWESLCSLVDHLINAFQKKGEALLMPSLQ
jgi:transposase